MKEATGELNMAVVVAISIGVLAAFFFRYLWPIIDNNFERTSQCSKAVCDCSELVDVNGVSYCKCWESGNPTQTFNCIFRG